MTFEEFTAVWVAMLQDAALPIVGVEAVSQSLDLRSMTRTCVSVVEARGQPPGDFHITAKLEFRWSSLLTARARTTEDDVLDELLGLNRGRKPRTKPPWLRVDATLRASTMWGHEIALPDRGVWGRWVKEILARLDGDERLIPAEIFRENRVGLPDILAWQSEPALEVICGPDGMLKLRGVEITSWQAIDLPRVWSDSDRRPDHHPSDQLSAMFKRVKAALGAWTDSSKSLASTP